MAPGPAADRWHAGDTYEDFMGRWSRPMAEEFIRWLRPAPSGDWLDVGTGTGAVAAAVCALAQPRSVVGCDASAAFVDFARARLTDPRVRFEVAGAEQLPTCEGGYDAVVSGLALNFFPDARRAVECQLAGARPGGIVAAFVWDYAAGMEFLRVFWDAAAELDPRASELDEGRRFPICDPDELEALFRSAGARNVRTGALTIPTRFADFADYWRPLLGGVGPAPGFVAMLAVEDRRRLAEALRARLAPSGGPVALRARAWAVAGVR